MRLDQIFWENDDANVISDCVGLWSESEKNPTLNIKLPGDYFVSDTKLVNDL